MEKFSISTLALPSDFQLPEMAPKLVEIGLQGIEIAPTMIWPSAPSVNKQKVSEFKEKIRHSGLQISGLQSLLFGKQNLNLFNRSNWPELTNHLIKIFALANHLETKVVVFGSPKNRVKGSLSIANANEIAALFFSSLIKYLQEFQVTLTLEPNAPEYGADFLITYDEVVTLTNLISSDFIKPQIDTGCLRMVGVDPSTASLKTLPKHIHVSSPNLGTLPDDYNHEKFAQTLSNKNYDGWIVLEIKNDGSINLNEILESAKWMISTYKIERRQK